MEANYFTILYWFCHTATWIRHGCTRVPHPEPPSHLPPLSLPLGHPSAPAPSNQYHASNLDWWFISYMILYMFQCHSAKSSHPLPLPQSPQYTLQDLLNTILNSLLLHCSLFRKLFCLLLFGPMFIFYLGCYVYYVKKDDKLHNTDRNHLFHI